MKRIAVAWVGVGVLLFALACSRGGEVERSDDGEAVSREVAPSAGEARSASIERVAATDGGQTLGFVLVDFTFDQPEMPENACPDGLNIDERELHAQTLAQRDPKAAAAVPPGFPYIIADRKTAPVDMCKEPAGFPSEPHLLVQGLEVAPGFDLDGIASSRTDPGANACVHEDLASPSGEGGIDNQLWSVLGCIKGYARGNTIDEFARANIREGQRTILVRLTGVDDLVNDDAVELGIYSSPDPVPVDAQGAIMDRASLSITSDPRHQNVTRARIVNGIALAGPFDLRLDFKGQFLAAEYALRAARIRLELKPDGTLAGLLGGYWDIEQFYDIYARQASRLGAFTVGFRCPGMYGAVKRQADAYPDPKTGECTAISTAFRMAGIPAFVIDPEPAPKLASVIGGRAGE
ncbi:hypothetical protein K2X89_10610 [Myxococcota bacterium]|nr:hypothetical protein [Myxococcota bacterium]